MKYLSVYETDQDILQAMSDIHLRGQWYEADITYSKGNFYTDKQPKYKTDLMPLSPEITQDDSQVLATLPMICKVNSIVFDPPFLFRDRVAVNNDKICARFSYFKSYEELQTMYKNSLRCIYEKLASKGYLFFKCQDMTDGKFYCTHNFIINFAQEIGFDLKDIFLKVNKHKLQADAKQQNCGAKVHSYWLVFKKLNPA
jgi:hypothetical protein